MALPVPDAELALELRTIANDKLLASLRYLLDVSAALGLHRERAQQHLSLVDTSGRLGGMYHVVHDTLVRSIRSRDVRAAQQALDVLCELNTGRGGQQVSVGGLKDCKYPRDAYTFYVDAVSRSYFRTYGTELEIQPSNGDELMNAVRAAIAAIERMEVVDPDSYREMLIYVSDVFVVHSMTMNAATSICALGIIRISHLKLGQTWSRYFENLVHETGHQHLNHVFLVDKLVDNEDSGLYSSPLRREPRPLSGILHALFVLARTIRAQRCLMSHPTYDHARDQINSAYNNSGNAASFEAKLADCWMILAQHAKLTEVGSRLVTNVMDMAASSVP